MATILTTTADYNEIRQDLGNLSTDDLSDTTIQGVNYLGVAEADLIGLVNAKATASAGAMPNVTQIMAGTTPAVAADKTWLQAAAIAYVVWLAIPQLLILIDQSVTIQGVLSVRKGTIGPGNWKELRETKGAAVGYYLSKITGWTETAQTNMLVTGPTSSGTLQDRLSGFKVVTVSN